MANMQVTTGFRNTIKNVTVYKLLVSDKITTFAH